VVVVVVTGIASSATVIEMEEATVSLPPAALSSKRTVRFVVAGLASMTTSARNLPFAQLRQLCEKTTVRPRAEISTSRQWVAPLTDALTTTRPPFDETPGGLTVTLTLARPEGAEVAETVVGRADTRARTRSTKTAREEHTTRAGL
jgi:hypothetical protein